MENSKAEHVLLGLCGVLARKMHWPKYTAAYFMQLVLLSSACPATWGISNTITEKAPPLFLLLHCLTCPCKPCAEALL